MAEINGSPGHVFTKLLRYRSNIRLKFQNKIITGLFPYFVICSRKFDLCKH